ncbi:efflux RND transporter permease subunit [Cupriavidus basilensis]
MREYLLKEEGGVVDSLFTVNGFNFAGRGRELGPGLHPAQAVGGAQRRQHQRVRPGGARQQRKFASFRDSMSFAFAPPAVQELGNATGFDLYLQDQAGLGHQALINARDKFLALASRGPDAAARSPQWPQ